jgi:hypothetical protein
MRIMDLIKQVPPLYASGTSLMLAGPPGVGKSSMRQRIVDILSAKYQEEFGSVATELPTKDAPDFCGFMVPTKDADGVLTSVYTRSAVAPTKAYIQAHPRGVMFIEEVLSGDILTQKAAAPCFLDRKFGDLQLPEGWWIVGTTNRSSDRSGATRSLAHLRNRVRWIDLEFDILSWSVWAEELELHPFGIACAKKNPGMFVTEVPDHDRPFCTPRSFVSALKLLSQIAGTDDNGNPSMKMPNDPVTQSLVAGDVGDGASATMFSFFKLHDQLPDIDDILKDPLKAKCPERLDAAYAAVQLCVHYANAKNIDALWQYVERLPKELQATTAKSLIERSGGALVNSKALAAWVAKNRALIVNTLD